MIKTLQIEQADYDVSRAFKAAATEAYHEGRYRWDFTLTLQSTSCLVNECEEDDGKQSDRHEMTYIYNFQVIYG